MTEWISSYLKEPPFRALIDGWVRKWQSWEQYNHSYSGNKQKKYGWKLEVSQNIHNANLEKKVNLNYTSILELCGRCVGQMVSLLNSGLIGGLALRPGQVIGLCYWARNIPLSQCPSFSLSLSPYRAQLFKAGLR